MQQEYETGGNFTLQDYQRYLRDISKLILEKYPKAVHSVTDGKVQMKSLQQMEQSMNTKEVHDETRMNKGRGGNNVAENMKKSVKSILKKALSPSLYTQFQQRYIKRYHLKSQKQNYVLYFLFLHELRAEGKLTGKTLEDVMTQIKQRVSKYARGSEERMQTEPERRQFHEKNMVQFKKFEDIDLDFSRPREYAQVKEWIRTLYLKKYAVYLQAERKVRAILAQHPTIQKMFVDLSESQLNQAQLKLESLSNEDAYQSSSDSLY